MVNELDIVMEEIRNRWQEADLIAENTHAETCAYARKLIGKIVHQALNDLLQVKDTIVTISEKDMRFIKYNEQLVEDISESYGLDISRDYSEGSLDVHVSLK